MNTETEQKSLKDISNNILGSGANLSATAAVIALLGMIMPFIGVYINDYTNGYMNAFQAANLGAWLMLAGFIVAALSRRVQSLSSYRNIIDIFTFGLAALFLVLVWFFNPVTSGMGQMEGLFGGQYIPSATLYPHIGMVAFLVSCGLLYVARKKV